jgi:hypothetical protein
VNTPDYDPKIADRDGYGNITARTCTGSVHMCSECPHFAVCEEHNRELWKPCGLEVCGSHDFCRSCPANGTRHCPK